MELDAWAAYFDTARKDGKGTLIEDDNFDLDEILANLEREAEERERQKAVDAPDDQWEPAEEWAADQEGAPDE